MQEKEQVQLARCDALDPPESVPRDQGARSDEDQRADLREIHEKVKKYARKRNCRRQRWKAGHYVLLTSSVVLSVVIGADMIWKDNLSGDLRGALALVAAVSAALSAAFNTEERQAQARRDRGRWEHLERTVAEALVQTKVDGLGGEELRQRRAVFRRRMDALLREEDGVKDAQTTTD